MTWATMDEAFWDWTNAVNFQVVQKAVADYEATEAPIILESFDGVLEPVHPRALLVKPEGQRVWKWWQMWSTKNLELNAIIQDQTGKQYRVMSTSDWNMGGGNYKQYELVQNPPLGS